MKKTPKALKDALVKVDHLPDDWFGKETLSFDDLPCISEKEQFTRTSIY